MNPRQQRADAMMEAEGYAHQFDNDKFSVRSQTDPTKSYTVTNTGGGLVCECPDRRFRRADCKHIKVVLDILKKNRCYKTNEFRIMDRSKFRLCRYCDSGRIARWGTRKNKRSSVQIYRCKDCKRQFTANPGFEKRRYDDVIITRALESYFRGHSARDIADSLGHEGVIVSHMTVYRWIAEYSEMISEYLSGIVPRVGDWVRADEIVVKVDGKRPYVFASMDDDTRYWIAYEMAETKFQHNADSLLELTREQIGRTPKVFKTDGLPAYARSSKKVFGKKTLHVRHIHLAGKRDRDNNNKMERLNGEIRDREKVFRGLKKFDTPVFAGMQAYYNFLKKHGALDGRTPAEAAKIVVDGFNKMKTIIQNAALCRDAEAAQNDRAPIGADL